MLITSLLSAIVAASAPVSTPVAAGVTQAPAWIDRLLGLRSLSAAATDVRIEFARPMPAWLWVGIAAACFAIAAWSYWRLIGARRARLCLAVIRGLTLLLLAVLIAGPQLTRANERIEKDWVVMMIDRSASMSIADLPAEVSADREAGEAGDGGDGQARGSRTREDQLKGILAGSAETLESLATKRNVLFTGFDAQAFDIPVSAAVGDQPFSVQLGQPTGVRTLLGQSIEQNITRLAARPVAAVVVFSDGRSPDQPSRALLRQLEARRIPVFTVPLGNPLSPPDLAILRVEAPQAAFVGDKIPVAVEVELLSSPQAAGAGEAVSVKVELVDQISGEVVAEQSVDVSRDSPKARPVLLVSREAPGIARYTVRLAGEGADLSASNNAQDVSIDVSDRPIRVIYFDGYPRWEYRYLKNILVRESSIRSVAMLLDPKRKFIQDGSEIIATLPRSPEEWDVFDVVVMGDVLPGVFTNEQIGQIRDLVSQRGAGLLWIGGSGPTPGAWRGTPLADLLPFVLPQSESDENAVATWLSPVLVKPTAAAQRYGVLQLSQDPAAPWPAELLDSDLGWPLMRWAQRFSSGMLKPTTEVLATASPAPAASLVISPSAPTLPGEDGAERGSEVEVSLQQAEPLVMSMRYGAGRVIYVGTDETWRYRYCRGEVLSERFWIPLVRLLARESLGRTGKSALLTASPQQVRLGQSVQVTARIIDQLLLQSRPGVLTASVRKEPTAAEPNPSVFGVTLAPQRADSEFDAGSSTEGSQRVASAYSTAYTAAAPGRYVVELTDPLLAGPSGDAGGPQNITARFEVVSADDELRFPQTDHPALAALAEQTGGRTLTKETLSQLPTMIPNRELRVLTTPDVETLWDKPAVWILLMLLLITEWAWRRIIKLA